MWKWREGAGVHAVARLQSIIYLFMPRCAAFNWLQLALISVPALDSSYGSPGSGASCCCCYGCCGCRVMFCISLTRERQCGLRKRQCSAPTPPVPVARLLLVLLHLAHYASSSSSFSCCRVQGLCIHLPLAWLVAGANILGSAHCSLSLSHCALHGIYLSKFANYCVSCPARNWNVDIYYDARLHLTIALLASF